METPLETVKSLPQTVREPPLPFSVQFATGAIAGVAGLTVVFPLDVAKTRLQKQISSSAVRGQYTTVWETLKTIFRHEGLHVLYRGLFPNVVGMLPESAVKLSVNGYLRDYFTDKNGSLPLFKQVLAGAASGFAQVAVTNPAELVKIRMQVMAMEGVKGVSPLTVLSQLGLKGMYTGLSATILRDVPFNIVFFSSYGLLKDVFADPDTGSLPLWKVLLIGCGCGTMAGAISTPSDMIKTRLQVEVKPGEVPYKGYLDCLQRSIRQEGLQALTKGMGPRCLIVSPMFGVTILSFEAINKLYRS